MVEIQIGPHRISRTSPECFVIAEVGHNHGGSIETCKQLFQAAKYAGATAVKLQKRDNRSLYTREFYDSVYNSENAYGSTYGAHREALEFDEAQYRDLKQFAEAIGLIFFAVAAWEKATAPYRAPWSVTARESKPRCAASVTRSSIRPRPSSRLNSEWT